MFPTTYLFSISLTLSFYSQSTAETLEDQLKADLQIGLKKGKKYIYIFSICSVIFSEKVLYSKTNGKII